MGACAHADLFCQLLDWMIRNIEIPLGLLIGVGAIYLIWLDGYTKGHTQGVISGIKHEINRKAFNTADFPEQYIDANDPLLVTARQQLANRLRPPNPDNP